METSGEDQPFFHPDRSYDDTHEIRFAPGSLCHFFFLLLRSLTASFHHPHPHVFLSHHQGKATPQQALSRQKAAMILLANMSILAKRHVSPGGQHAQPFANQPFVTEQPSKAGETLATIYALLAKVLSLKTSEISDVTAGAFTQMICSSDGCAQDAPTLKGPSVLTVYFNAFLL